MHTQEKPLKQNMSYPKKSSFYWSISNRNQSILLLPCLSKLFIKQITSHSKYFKVGFGTCSYTSIMLAARNCVSLSGSVLRSVFGNSCIKIVNIREQFLLSCYIGGTMRNYTRDNI